MRFLNHIAVLLLCAAAAAARGANWYVDYETGDDDNAGSEASPFKHCPGDTRADSAALAAYTTLAGGDTIYFKTGTKYSGATGSSIILKSGTPGNPITYDGESWGAGADCVYDGENESLRGFKDNGSARNHIIIQGFPIQNLGGYAVDDPVWDSGIVVTPSSATQIFTTATPHGYVVGDEINFTYGTGAVRPTGTPRSLPGGVASAFYCKVTSTPTPTTFTVDLWDHATDTGEPFTLTSDGSGEIKVWKHLASRGQSVGIDLNGGGNDIIVRRCTFARFSTWQNTFPVRNSQSIGGTGIDLEGNDGVIIQDCDFTQMKVGIGMTSKVSNPLENVVIDGVEIHDYVQWCIDVNQSDSGAVFQNIEIKNSIIRDYAQYDNGNWASWGEWPHTDGIFPRTTAKLSTWTNFRIHGNEFYNDYAGASKGGTAAIYFSQGSQGLVYNNIFAGIRMATGTIAVGHTNPGSQVNDIGIYNNTFIGGPKAINIAGETEPTQRFVRIKNNIFWRSTADTNTAWLNVDKNSAGVVAAGLTELDYNLYYNPLVSELLNKAWIRAGNYRTIQRMRDDLGLEINGKYLDPLFVSTTGPFSNLDLYINNPLSPARGMGENLSHIFTTDKDGNPRPSTGPWDVGAYVSDAPVPADEVAPVLSDVTINGSTVSLQFSESVTGVNAAHWTMSGGITLSAASGSNTLWTMTASPAAVFGGTHTISYTPGTVEDLASPANALAAIVARSVTNQTPETPTPPAVKNRGRTLRNKGQLLNR